MLGSFLGTVDVRKGSELEAESSLKFFEWSDIQSKYRLGAQVRLWVDVYIFVAVEFCVNCCIICRVLKRKFDIHIIICQLTFTVYPPTLSFSLTLYSDG